MVRLFFSIYNEYGLNLARALDRSIKPLFTAVICVQRHAFQSVYEALCEESRAERSKGSLHLTDRYLSVR